MREQVVYLLSQANLRHLQLGKVIGHNCIFVVGKNHLLEEKHVLGGELAEAFINLSANIWVILCLSINNILDILLAFVKVSNKLSEIVEHKFAILQNLCCRTHFLNVFSGQISLIIQNTHCIRVLLAVEKNIETCLFEMFQIEFVWKFTKEGAFFQIIGVWLEDLDIEFVVLEGGVKLKDDWLIESSLVLLVLKELSKIRDDSHCTII